MSAPSPITLAHVLQKLPKLDAQASHYADFFTGLGQSIAKELQLYNTVPVKCAILREAPVAFTEAEDTKPVFVLRAPQGRLRIWYEADRGFDQILCELCLGGTGVPEPEEDGVRPPSKFERRFRSTVLRKLLAAVPMAAKRACNVELDVATEPAEASDTPPEKVAGAAGLELVFQLNAFTFTSEIKLRFLEEELALCLEATPGAGPTALCAKDVLGDCAFGFEAYLRPKEVALSDIINLEVGHVIALGLGISDPVLLYCEGRPVFHAAMTLGEAQMQLTLQSEIDTTTTARQRAA